MAVLEAYSITLEVPNLQVGVEFYQNAGLEAVVSDNVAGMRCSGQTHSSINLIGGKPAKRLHHITLRADGLDEIAARIPTAGGAVTSAPAGFEGEDGLWVLDPHGMLIHLIDSPAEPDLAEVPIFEINAPGRVLRKRRSAVLPIASYPPAKPLRLGHILVFSPEPMRSVDFLVNALGMGLADHAQGIIAFCCATKNSDHHVVAFAKSSQIGFHHVSFHVADPDEVGRGGSALVAKVGLGDWGFGRHTIGSNFFHYIQDPWGSWFEYIADIDHIDDYALWTPTDYGMEDSLASWAPPVPKDFIHNYEADEGGFNFQQSSN